MVADWLNDIAPVSSNNWALVFVLHVATTMFLVGLIWMVQIVHYPLLAHVGDNTFLAYHKRHTQWITTLVAPLMLLELATGLLLWLMSPLHPFWILNTMGIAVIWGSTALWQVRLHKQLPLVDGAARLSLIHQLIASNWLRTIVWSFRGTFLVGWLLKLLKS
jgi:hypothetical protein